MREAVRALFAIAGVILCATSGVRGAIVTTGDVVPDPVTATSSTTLIVGNTADGTMIIDGGSVLGTNTGLIGENAGVQGAVAVMGANSTWTNTDRLVVGERGVGTLTITGGGKVSCVGGFVTRSSTVLVEGVGSSWAAEALAVGYTTGGTLTISNSGAVNVHGPTTVAVDGGAGAIEFNNGTLTTGTLYTQVNCLRGAGVIYAHGTVIDADLVFDPTATITLNSEPGQNIVLHLDADGSADMGAGYRGQGSLTIQGGVAAKSKRGQLGVQSGAVGIAHVEGPGSSWTMTGILSVGTLGRGELTISNGAKVISTRSSIQSGSGNSVATVDGTASSWTNSGDLYVGNFGSGVLAIINGARVDVGALTMVSGLGGTGAIQFSNGTLNTNSLQASPGRLTGTGTISTKGLVSDMDLVFDQTHGKQQQLVLNGAGQNILINLDVNGTGLLGAGHEGQGTLTIRGGVSVTSTFGDLGFKSGSDGLAVVDGAGSAWLFTGMTVGQSGSGMMRIVNGGSVTGSATVSSRSGSAGAIVVDGTGSAWKASTADIGLGGSGTLTISNGGSASATVASVGNSEGSIGDVNVGGAGSTWTVGQLNLAEFKLTIGSSGAGTLTITTGGLVKVQTGLGLWIGERSSGKGTVNLAGGTLDLMGRNITKGAGAATFNFTGGTLKNVGTFGMSLHQEGGTLAAGASPGTMVIAGDYALDSAGVLEVELAGAGNVKGTHFDFYNVAGNADLDGMVNVVRLGGYVPTFGKTFDVLTAGSIDATGLRISGGYEFAVVSGGNGQVLRVTAVPEPGTLGLMAVGTVGALMKRGPRRGRRKWW